MGLQFAKKLEGAVALQTCRIKGGEENNHLTFHWAKIRHDVAKDIETAKTEYWFDPEVETLACTLL